MVTSSSVQETVTITTRVTDNDGKTGQARSVLAVSQVRHGQALTPEP
jgi:hypothetical protein